jgi:hypothetical protein
MKRLFVAFISAFLAWAPAAFALTDAAVPTMIPTTWGASAPGGNITCPIPTPSQLSITAGRASWTDGFPPLTFQPVGSGGIPPFGQDFNGVLCQLSQWTRWYNAGAPISYNSAFQTAIGGYPNGSIIASLAYAGTLWRSTADNNVTNPDTGGAGWNNAQPISPPSASGLKLINGSGAPNTTTTITAAFVTMDNAAATLSLSAQAVNVTISTAASGAGGLDVGSIAARTWYYVYLIDNGTTVSGVYSLSATGPTLPSGYIVFDRVGAVLTDGSSNLMQVRQQGNVAQYIVTAATNTATLPIMASGSAGDASAPTYVAIALASYVPQTATRIRGVAISTAGLMIVAPNSAYGAFNSLTNPPPIAMHPYYTIGEQFDLLLESSNIYWAGGGTVACLGWVDNVPVN